MVRVSIVEHITMAANKHEGKKKNNNRAKVWEVIDR